MANKIQKPNWQPIELNAKLNRWNELRYETENAIDCDCNSCMEFYGLTQLLELFTEDEKAGAVIAANKIIKGDK